MTRRHFHQVCASTITLFPISTWPVTAMDSLIKPKKLFPGAKIGLVAPGGPVSGEKLAKAIDNVAALDMQAVLGKHVTKSHGFLAGKDSERLEDLHRMFSDPEIDGIWCIRGGYGSTRLLPHLDYDMIRQNAKVFVGYSDVTALHVALLQRCNLVTFHGPVASSEPTPYTMAHLRKMIFGGSPGSIMNAPIKQNVDSTFERFVIKPGKAEGTLLGGNLSLLAAMAGTPYSPGYANKIVFLEDVGEKPYRIDRMLVQLFQATDLAKAAAIILGVFYDCEADEDSDSLSLKETLLHQFENLPVPVYYGFSFGHVDDQCTLAMGIRCSFETNTEILTLTESSLT